MLQVWDTTSLAGIHIHHHLEVESIPATLLKAFTTRNNHHEIKCLRTLGEDFWIFCSNLLWKHKIVLFMPIMIFTGWVTLRYYYVFCFIFLTMLDRGHINALRVKIGSSTIPRRQWLSCSSGFREHGIINRLLLKYLESNALAWNWVWHPWPMTPMWMKHCFDLLIWVMQSFITNWLEMD